MFPDIAQAPCLVCSEKNSQELEIPRNQLDKKALWAEAVVALRFDWDSVEPLLPSC